MIKSKYYQLVEAVILCGVISSLGVIDSSAVKASTIQQSTTIGECTTLEAFSLIFTKINAISDDQVLFDNWEVDLNASSILGYEDGFAVDLSRYELQLSGLATGVNQIDYEVSVSPIIGGYPSLNNIFYYGGFFFTESTNLTNYSTQVWADNINGSFELYNSATEYDGFPWVLDETPLPPIPGFPTDFSSIFVRTTFESLDLDEINTITNVISSPLPEPLTILGSSTAVAIGAFFKKTKSRNLRK